MTALCHGIGEHPQAVVADGVVELRALIGAYEGNHNACQAYRQHQSHDHGHEPEPQAAKQRPIPEPIIEG